MYEIIKIRFKEVEGLNTYSRIDETHPLDIYVGFNEENRKSLAIVITGEIKPFESTKMIAVKIAKRQDERIILSFNLLEEAMNDVFYKFCADIIESTRNYTQYNSFNFIIERWERWISLFTKTRMQLLAENEIRGLLGELIFLNEVMFEKYGIEKSINSWQGPSQSHKDFEIEDTWYEVKTIRQNGYTVKINSVEQLDSNLEGKLIVIKLEEGNIEMVEYITLNKYIIGLLDKIKDLKLREVFENKLSQIGYFYDLEYDCYVYSKKGIETYKVNKEFPRIKNKELREGNVRISYELYLDVIKCFKVSGE